MTNDISTEITYSLIFFTFGLIVGIGYIFTAKLEKIIKIKVLEYLTDCLFVTVCFILFYKFYISVLDGVLYFYEIIFFLLGLCVAIKYIGKILNNLVIFYNKKQPKALKKLNLKIKNIIKK